MYIVLWITLFCISGIFLQGTYDWRSIIEIFTYFVNINLQIIKIEQIIIIWKIKMFFFCLKSN